MKIDVDDFVSMLSSADVDELAKALEREGRTYSDEDMDEACAEAAEEARADARQERDDLLIEIAGLVRERRFDDLELLIERERFPRRKQNSDLHAVAA